MTENRARKNDIRRRMDATGEKYTQARRAMVEPAATAPVPPPYIEEALRLGHDYIGCEHLLLGALADERGVAAKAADHGVTLDSGRRWIREAVASAQPGGSSDGMSFTPRAIVVRRLAEIEAERLGELRPRDGHVVLAILTEGEGVPNHLLHAVGVDLAKLRLDLLEALEVPADLREAYLRQRLAAEQARRAPKASRDDRG